MFCKLPKTVFLSFLFLFMCCAMCEHAAAAVTSQTSQNTITLLKQTTEVREINDADRETIKHFKSFTSPSLGYVNGVLFVFAQAKNDADEEDEYDAKCDIVEGYVHLKDNIDMTDLFKESTADKEWTKRFLKKNENYSTENPTALVDNTDIYLFFKHFILTEDNDLKWEYKLIKGDLKDKNRIMWDFFSKASEEEIKLGSKDFKKISFFASGGFGIVANDDFVFPVWYKENGNDFLSVIIYSKKNGKTWDFVLSNPQIKGKYPAIVKWNEKLIIMTSCSDGYRKVYESVDMGKTWTEAAGFFGGLWENTGKLTGNKCGRNGFITAKINEEKEVMLVSQPIKTKKVESKYELHLWMTDYNRVSLA